MKLLENLEKRKSGGSGVVVPEFARTMCSFSYSTGRQVGVLLRRNGEVEYVIAGSSDEIVIPVLSRFRLTPGRLRGLRLVHTHPSGKGLDEDDLTDLALLRLDSVTVLSYDDAGNPKNMETAYLLPADSPETYGFLPDRSPYAQSVDYLGFIEALDDEILAKSAVGSSTSKESYGVLTGWFKDKASAERNMDELEELARSAGVKVIARMPQTRGTVHPKYVVGPGKLKEIVIKALGMGAEYVIFDNSLSPSQSRAVSLFTEMKAIDRTQLILDIFAKRARSNDGKIRVELAQLKYILPRLSGRDDSLSRLTGGIGGRGPGETKLEIDKRRITDRIAFLSAKLKKLERMRNTQRELRRKNEVPVVSIIGYTNAGKSTLLNSLTKSDVYADDLLFATLDTSSKRIRFPREGDVIITDTVGFIRDLPPDLAGAFKSTLEELNEADLFLHVVDASDEYYEDRIKAVEKVLEDMNLLSSGRLIVFNKTDLISVKKLRDMENLYPQAVFISAKDRETFKTMLEKIRYYFFRKGSSWIAEIRDNFD